MDYSRFFPDTKRDDLCLTLGGFKPGKLPLKRACIKTETGFEELDGSMAELGNGILLAVQSERCGDTDLILRPLDQRGEELESYRKRGCALRRNGDSNSNFLTVAPTGDGTVWIRNEGDRSLRLQTPDGLIYRVCTGYTEPLAPSNIQALVAPIQILLDLGGNPLDLRVSAIHVRYGKTPWQRGGIDCRSGSHVDSYFCRIFCGDDCMGVVESYSDYFLGKPKLEFLSIKSYGPSLWYARNKGSAPFSLVWPDGRTAEAPADGRVYRLETLAAPRERRQIDDLQ